MKRQIRLAVFETNSSSTHSISICNIDEIKCINIPKNTTIIIDNTYDNGNSTIYNEMGKLNYIITILASIVEYYEDELNIKSFDEMIKMNWFKWVSDVVKEKSNTDIIYKCPDSYYARYLPYYTITYSDDDTVENIFTGGDSEILKNEMKFKERVTNIIYNPLIIIKDEEFDY